MCPKGKRWGLDKGEGFFYNRAMEIQTYQLENGIALPKIGLGTFRIKPDDCERTVSSALQSGYRLIDTANVYMNERAVGRGVKASGVPREEILVASKIWCTEYKYKKAVAAIDATLLRLGLDVLDILILHQPFGRVDEAWRAAEEAVKSGKVRLLGVSNFDEDDLEKLLTYCTVKPILDQVECHPYCARRMLAKYLKEHGILLESWYPLGSGSAGLFSEKIVTSLAEKYQRSPAQILLRWHVEEGYLPIPGTKNPLHAAENADIFDFSLTPEELSSLRALDKNERFFKMRKGIQRRAVFFQRMNYDKQK